MKYTFIEQHSNRAIQDGKLLIEIKRSYDDSYGIYGSPRIHRDLRETGFNCGVKRVARLMHQAKLKSTRGYRRPRYKLACGAITTGHCATHDYSIATNRCCACKILTNRSNICLTP